MSISSLLFRDSMEPLDTETNQPERPVRSLRRTLKPWPLPPATEPTRLVDFDDEEDEEFREPTPAVVLDRLSRFAARR